MTLKLDSPAKKPECFTCFFRNVTLNPFATAIALVGITTLIRSLMVPDDLPTSGLASSDFLDVGCFYALGGFGLLMGLGFTNTRLQSAGCVLLSVGCFIYGFFALVGTNWTGVNYFIYGAAALWRLNHLMRGEVLMWVVKTDDDYDSSND